MIGQMFFPRILLIAYGALMWRRTIMPQRMIDVVLLSRKGFIANITPRSRRGVLSFVILHVFLSCECLCTKLLKRKNNENGKN